MKKNLDEKDLEAVSGGNFGDIELEYGDTPESVRFLYNIGDHVEVYKSSFIHGCTDGGTVINRKTNSKIEGCETVYYGSYLVKYDKGGKEGWVIATHIERD